MSERNLTVCGEPVYTADVSLGSAKFSLVFCSHISFAMRPEKTHPGRRFMHRHTQCEIIYVYRGSMRMYFVRGSVEVCEGELMMIRPGEYHRSETFGAGCGYCLFHAVLREQKGEPADAYSVLDSLLQGEHHRILALTTEQMPQLAECIRAEKQPLSDSLLLTAQTAFGALAAELYRTTRQERQRNAAVGSETAQRFITDEFFNCYYYYADISLASLASLLHLSEKQTARVVKGFYGVTFGQYVMQMRMVNAAYLLENTDCSVEEISECVGYPSTHYFYGRFRAYYGCTPHEYRKELFIKRT